MKIKILKPVLLDIDGKSKQYEPSDKVIEIDDTIAKRRDYENRYTVYSDYIEIVEGVKKEEPKKELPEKEEVPVVEDSKEEVKPKPATRKRVAKKELPEKE